MSADPTPTPAPLPDPAWTRRIATYPRDAGIHQVFAEVAGRHPTLPAVRTVEGDLSYAELDRRANRLANALIASGVGRGDRVGLLLDRSAALIIAQLAVFKAGALNVPIDPASPTERVAFFAGDAGLRLMLVAGETVTAPLPAGLDRLALDGEAAALAGAGDADPGISSGGGDPAFVLYTSGSTGQPKGVISPHRGLVRLVRGQDYFPSGPGECMLLLGSPGFDVSTFEIWSALLNGGCCAVFPDRRVDYRRLGELIRSFGASSLSFATGLFNRIVDHDPSMLESARYVIIAGEALSAEHIRRAMARLPAVRFANGYGPTECSVFAVSWIIGEPRQWGCESVPLGHPLANTECHIVDEALRPVPVGVVGELLLGGDGLALGYLNRPEQTAERFIRHPFSDDPTARLYRSGDRGYWLADGRIAYVGRNDDQVKIRGYRIELGEVEAALRGSPGVRDAAAFVRVFPSGIRGLVGCVVPAAGSPFSETAMIDELSLRLPEFMVPMRVWACESLPLNQNGKVDRRRLAEHYEAGPGAAAGAAAEAFPGFLAEVLAIWRRVLRDPAVGPDTDFFRCGGDSLLAMELTVEIERWLGREIPAGSIHRFSSARVLAAWLQDPGQPPDAALDRLIGEGDGPPVIFLPGLEGYGLMPRELAKALEGRHPYHDRLVFPPVRADSPESVSVESIAATLLPRLRRLCPPGPCVLVGFSFGGFVAFELARQRAAAGDGLARVVLWDSVPAAAYVRRSLGAVLWTMTRLALSPQTWREPGRLRQRLARFGRLLGVLRDRLSGRLTGDTRRARTAIEEVPPAALAFQPRAYNGSVAVLAATRDDHSVFSRYLSARDGWAAVVAAERLVVHEFPCTHREILRPPQLDAFVARTLALIEGVDAP